MDLIGQLHRMSKDEVIDFVQKCQDPETGGFAATLHHDPHLLYTLSALQVSPLVSGYIYRQYSITPLIQTPEMGIYNNSSTPTP